MINRVKISPKDEKNENDEKNNININSIFKENNIEIYGDLIVNKNMNNNENNNMQNILSRIISIKPDKRFNTNQFVKYFILISHLIIVINNIIKSLEYSIFKVKF